MTELLYMDDNYLKTFTATVSDVGNNYVELDTTAFYPKGGGQPCDTGVLQNGPVEATVTKVRKSHGEIRHFIDNTDAFSEGDRVEGVLDWERRYDHMRMHTAQHLVSAVILDMFDASTAGNQIHREYSRIDFKPLTLDEERIQKIENLCNSRIAEELRVEKSFMPRKHVEERVQPGRTNLDLIPDSVDPLRVVEIQGFDMCPCGGTHVNNLDEIGSINITETENKGSSTERVVFELA